MPFGAMNGVLTSNANERIKLSGMRMVIANIGLNGMGVLAIPLVVFFSAAGGAYTAHGYFMAVLVTGIVGVPFLMWTAITCREVLLPPPQQKKVTMKQNLQCIFGNKYMLMIIVSNLCAGIVMYGRMTMLT
jgi:Na+/melibiose symporter-like transporter